MKRFLPFAPPVYNDIEKDYRATLVYTLSWAWIIAITILGGTEIAVMPVYWRDEFVIIVAIDITAFVCLLLNQHHRTRLASILLPLLLWLIMTERALISGGIYASAIVAYLPIIITSGFLLGAWTGTAMAVVCMLSTLTFVLLDITGSLPAKWVTHTPLTTWICYTLSCLQITVMQFWVAGRIRQSFKTITTETHDREQAEMQLKKSEFNYRMVVENNLFGVGWVTPDGCMINASDTMVNMVGYSKAELISMHFSEVTHPDDLPHELELLDKIKRGEINSYIIEKRFRHKDGHYFWVELYRTAYYNQDTKKIEFFIAIIRNIQKRKTAEDYLKESEERYRVLVENSVEAVVVFDLDKGTFVSFSDSALQLFKATKEQLLVRGPADISPPYQPNGRPSAEFALEKINEAVKGYKPVFEWTHCDLEGNNILTEVRLVRLPASNSSLVKGSIIDITERKKAEEELRLSNERLRQLSAHLQTVREEERTGIAREIHDELGQQLTGLKMDASALIKEIPAGNNPVHIKIETMLGVIDDTINTVNKISSDLRPSLLDNLGLQAALEWQSSEFEKRTGITCKFTPQQVHEYNFDKDLATCVFRIYQEALTNIIRHAHATEVNTTYTITQNMLTLIISDNGAGFDVEKQKAKNTFGLTGMEERARMLHGQFNIASQPGRGTTILLKIPFTAQPEKI